MIGLKYDASVDAAYISLESGEEGAPFGYTYGCDMTAIGGLINLDFDIDGRLIGIEILQASKKLPTNLLPRVK